MMGRVLWILLGCLAFLPAVHAASFDCAKAATSVEKTICGDDKLSQLDSDLSVAYKHVLETAPNKQLLIHEQRQWIHDVRDACANVDCLTEVYTIRLQEVPKSAILRAAMARHDARRRIDPSSYRFTYALVDLDGDGIQDAVVYLNADCGSGGCAMRIMKGTKDGFTYASGSTITKLPVYVLPSKTNGWHDIAVTIGGGGLKGGTVILKYNGRGYPLNPALQPSFPVDPNLPGIAKLPLYGLRGTCPVTIKCTAID